MELNENIDVTVEDESEVESTEEVTKDVVDEPEETPEEEPTKEVTEDAPIEPYDIASVEEIEELVNENFPDETDEKEDASDTEESEAGETKEPEPTGSSVEEEPIVTPEDESGEDSLKEEVNPIQAAANAGVQVGSVVRLILMLISWINQVAVTFGTYSIPEIPESVTYIIATIITIAVSLYSYWKNNSWTKGAKAGDKVMQIVNSTGIDTDEALVALGTALSSLKK
jgi:SPP1 family holin